MTNPKIEHFAESLMNFVRDEAIMNCNSRLRKDNSSPIAKRWRANGYADNCESMVKLIITDVVDEVIFKLLNSIDNGEILLSYQDNSGESIALHDVGMGELAGDFMGIDSWRDKYSKEIYNHYLD